ncbi:MAG TPA: hypothetical protein VGI20_12740 [Rhizomicrobium sp.]|jgi:YVTN family beta-propeller protein
MRDKALIVVFTLTCMAAPATAATPEAPAPAYTITKTIALGAPDRWDYLTFDAPGGRLYIAHGDRVTVVDGKSGAILGEVAGLPGGTHGIAIVSSQGRGYTVDGKAGIAASFDLKTFQIVHRIAAQPDADGVLFDSASGHVFVIEGDSAKVTAIDPATDKAIATIDGGGGLEFGTVGGNGKIYVDGEEKNEVVRIDTATDKADAHWPLEGCKSPRGSAFDPLTHRLFASCGNDVLAVVDTDSGKTVTTLPIGDGTDAAAFDPKRKLVFSSNREGTLSVILEKSATEFVPQPTIKTQYGARTMALDPESGRIYLVAADFTVNPKVPASDRRHRFTVTPGTARLLFLDPR